MELKPQDIVVALCLRSPGGDFSSTVPASQRELAGRTGLSQAEIHKSLKRSAKLELIRKSMSELEMGSSRRLDYHLNVPALQEFLCYGVRYYSQPDALGYGRGIPSGWHCHELAREGEMLLPSVPIVWQHNKGPLRGEQITPIHSSALIASKDFAVHAVLALIDILRTGKAREVGIARDLLKRHLEEWRPASQDTGQGLQALGNI